MSRSRQSSDRVLFNLFSRSRNERKVLQVEPGQKTPSREKRRAEYYKDDDDFRDGEEGRGAYSLQGLFSSVFFYWGMLYRALFRGAYSPPFLHGSAYLVRVTVWCPIDFFLFFEKARALRVYLVTKQTQLPCTREVGQTVKAPRSALALMTFLLRESERTAAAIKNPQCTTSIRNKKKTPERRFMYDLWYSACAEKTAWRAFVFPAHSPGRCKPDPRV